MRIARGMSYRDGFDIVGTVGKKKCVINAIKDENGNCFVKCSNSVRKKVRNPNILRVIVLLFFSIAMSLLFNYKGKALDNRFVRIAFIVGVWVIAYVVVLICSLNKSYHSFFRYHAVEHMVLNYYDKHTNPPQSVEDLKKEDKIYFSCGSTLVVLFAMMISNVFIVIPFFTINVFLNAFLVCMSIFIPFCLLVYDKLNFVQKRLVLPPNDEDIYLGILVLEQIYKGINKTETKNDNLDVTTL